jgi:hypothetical protein
MHAWTLGNRHDRRTARSPLRGGILFALGVITLSYIELGLVARAPESTAGDYVALASDLTRVLPEGMHDTSAKGSDAREGRGVIPASSSTARVQ